MLGVDARDDEHEQAELTVCEEVVQAELHPLSWDLLLHSVLASWQERLTLWSSNDTPPYACLHVHRALPPLVAGAPQPAVILKHPAVCALPSWQLRITVSLSQDTLPLTPCPPLLVVAPHPVVILQHNGHKDLGWVCGVDGTIIPQDLQHPAA